MKRKTARPELTPSQEKAFQTILNLRKLTQDTGTFTTRAQNTVLRSLSDADLAAVANALAVLNSPTVEQTVLTGGADDGSRK